MRYPENLRVIVDITKPPYCADSTGKTDCTQIINRAYNDIIEEDIKLVRETYEKLKGAPDGKNTYLGFQFRKTDYGELNVSYSEHLPPAKIIYFPRGTYLISDTVCYQTRRSRKLHFGNKWYFELNRNIHFEGEHREESIIKLRDHAHGFEYGQMRPVINFLLRPESFVEHIANNAMLNTCKDLTIDCGEGNPGAVGLKFYANNSGRIANVTVKCREGFAGILMVGGTTGAVTDVKISGFDYGILATHTAYQLYENIELESQKIYGIFAKETFNAYRNIKSKNTVPTIGVSSQNAQGVFMNVEGKRGLSKSYIYDADEHKMTFPPLRLGAQSQETGPKLGIAEIPRFDYPDVTEWVCVDDYGAVGDGETDSTAAIQSALNCGAAVIYFNQGRYVISDEIYIPQTVKMINFCFCDLVAGEKLREGKGLGAFVVSENSKDKLFMVNAYAWEHFCGMFRFVRHSAKRDLVLEDIHLQGASVYFNTVRGSCVFITDVACTTGDFSEWYFSSRAGEQPRFAENIPFEFHGQKVWARNINPERADLEILNDGGEAVLINLYGEGPGTLIKTVNGGRSEIFTFTAAAGNDNPEKAVIVNDNSSVLALCGHVYGIQSGRCKYPTVVREIRGKEIREIHWEDLKTTDGVNCYFGGYIG